jgi:putative chitinase
MIQLTAQTLAEACHIKPADAAPWVEPLNLAMARFEITTPARVAMFLPNLAHESQRFRRGRENLYYTTTARLLDMFGRHVTQAEAPRFLRQPEKLANRVYANRLGNGPESSGDGWRFRGGGPIGLTFRRNYRLCGADIGFTLEEQPELIERKDVGALAAAWFWWTNGCNAMADAGKFDAICDAINLGHQTKKVGDSNGYQDRLALFASAKTAIGVA